MLCGTFKGARSHNLSTRGYMFLVLEASFFFKNVDTNSTSNRSNDPAKVVAAPRSEKKNNFLLLWCLLLMVFSAEETRILLMKLLSARLTLLLLRSCGCMSVLLFSASYDELIEVG
jgi:hypothetical protein